MDQKKILVTGGTGMLGSHLIKKLIEKNENVTALYRSGIPSFSGAEKVEWIKADINDIISLESASQNVYQVYHCAGLVSFSPKKRNELFYTNVEGTANVVNTCLNKGIEKLLFVSSVASLGRIRENELVNESMNWNEATGNSEYGKSKYLAEMEVWRGMGEGLKAVIVNPSIILGAGDWNKGSSKIFKTVYEKFPWYTDGVSGFVDVTDVIEAMILLMESDIVSQRYIISGVNISYQKLLTAIAKNFNKPPPHKKVTTFISSLVWRLEAIKGRLTGDDPLLTRETASTALSKVLFDNTLFLKKFPEFAYTKIENSIKRICMELKAVNHLQ